MITYEEVRHVFDYRKDGEMIWKNPYTKHSKKGDIAGHMKADGYCQMNYKGQQYKRSRLVWLWHNRSLPERNIYHINGDHSDDRIENLALLDESISDNKISYEIVRKYFDYRDDGNLIWKIYPGGSGLAMPGDVAGSLSGNGYYVIGFKGKRWKRSRLIWFWHHGYEPENFLDHINQIKTDDRIENLREVTNACNMRNSGNNKGNTSGVKGVYWYKRKDMWSVELHYNKKRYFLGYHNDFVDAVFYRYATEQFLNWEGCEERSPSRQYIIDNKLMDEYEKRKKGIMNSVKNKFS